MKFTIPPEVIEVSNTLTKNGFEAYLVGGAVRDLVMGKPATDWDFTTNALPDEILALFGERAFYNNTFGTVGVTPTNESFEPHEITTFRHESSYTDYRRPDSIEWGKTLEGDLTRRDFTINAMAINLETDQELIDPFDGQKDIKNKIIRTVGDPFERFGEDALRLMRAVRIAGQLGFTIEATTHQAMVEQATLINRIAKERVREELMKILSSADPYHGILLLKETQLLSQILPELEKCFGVDQKSPQRHHIYDVGTHLLMALKNCKSTNPITRFATLIHDIGKPQTVRKLESGVITFYNHEMVSTKIAERIADRLRFSNEEKDLLTRLVRWHQFTVDEHQTDSAIRRFIRNVGVENLDEMLALRVADRLGGGARETSWRLEEFKARLAEVQLQPFSIKDLKINGQDVMQELSLTPGPEVGTILNKLFADVEEKKVENEREALLSQIRSY